MGQFECCICGETKKGKKFKTKDGKNICRECALSAVSGTNKTIVVWRHTSEEFKTMINKNQNRTYDLNTAKGMYDYAVKNGMANETTENLGIKHFGQIYLSLINDEIVEFPFICMAEDNATMACAVTNKRIIFAKKKMMSAITKAINLDKINDVSMNVGQIFATIKIRSNNDSFVLQISKLNAQTIYRVLNEKIHKDSEVVDNALSSPERENKDIVEKDKFEEIREFKKLFDEGIISEEEFTKKKKEILKL